MPAAEVLATGKPVVARDIDIDRYTNPNFRRFVALGLKSICSVPLITRDRTIGTLALSRMTDDVWTSEDVEFLAQVASQIAIAVENSLAYRELSEMKERLATEKLYLEDEIRLDNNIGNMVGLSIHPEEHSDCCADRFDRPHFGRNRNRKRTGRSGDSRIESTEEGHLR